MPISKSEFENGKLHSKLEEEIINFLRERSDRAFTSQEIMEGLRLHAEFSTPEISKMSTFSIADFTTFLHQLLEKGKLRMKIVRGRMYIMAGEEKAAKCPKCGLEVTAPKKTWKMAGRPSRRGEKLQLQIGLYQCPKHGNFRVVLDKQKITNPVSAKGLVEKKKATAVKRCATKTREKTKGKRKKSKPLMLI